MTREEKKREGQVLLGIGGSFFVVAAGILGFSIYSLAKRDMVCVEAGMNKECMRTEKRSSPQNRFNGLAFLGIAGLTAGIGAIPFSFGIVSNRQFKAVTASVKF